MRSIRSHGIASGGQAGERKPVPARREEVTGKLGQEKFTPGEESQNEGRKGRKKRGFSFIEEKCWGVGGFQYCEGEDERGKSQKRYQKVEEPHANKKRARRKKN